MADVLSWAFSMSLIGNFFIALIAVAFAATAFVVAGFNVKRARIIRAAAKLTPEELGRIYRLVEECGTAPSEGFVLARTNAVAADQSCLVLIPSEYKVLPWAGKLVWLKTDTEIRFGVGSGEPASTQLLGRKFSTVAVPRLIDKTGKKRSVFNPRRYLKLNKQLAETLGKLYPQYPSELLAYLLSPGLDTFEFDGINQARIGTSPAWIQDPEFPSCEDCGKTMSFILQLPGSLLHKKAFHQATFYLFGCKKHPDKLRSVTQYS